MPYLRQNRYFLNSYQRRELGRGQCYAQAFDFTRLTFVPVECAWEVVFLWSFLPHNCSSILSSQKSHEKESASWLIIHIISQLNGFRIIPQFVSSRISWWMHFWLDVATAIAAYWPLYFPPTGQSHLLKTIIMAEERKYKKIHPKEWKCFLLFFWCYQLT